ncbi:MAG: hypothetical protein AAF549_00225 [Pseudomonadota bacterium]
MFSQLGPLFKTTFRQAESNDTRQHIPHDERDKGRKKREEEESQSQKQEAWVDDTAVSVDSLRTFLINFLKTIPEAQDELSDLDAGQDTAYSRPHEKTRPTNTHNAKAVRAYQTMAQKGQESAPPRPTEQIDNKPTADKVASKELRDIYQLIDDLEVLKRRNIQNLQIKPAESFVESLKKAVALALSQI